MTAERGQLVTAKTEELPADVDRTEAPAGVAHAAHERLGYRPGLDGLRAIAILAVMAGHTWEWLVPGGFIGVDLFFVLSGFLITTLLLEERARTGRISLKLFYARRALRLLPALGLLITAVGLWIVVASPSPLREASIRGLPAVALYAANWVWGVFNNEIGVFSHTWSLSLEEQFYLLWPAVVLGIVAVFGFRRGQKAALVGCVSIVALAVILRWELAGRDFTDEGIRRLTNTRGDVLLVGCALALIGYRGWLAKVPRRLVTVSTGLSVAALVYFGILVRHGVHDFVFFRGGFTVVALAAAVLIVRVVHVPSPAMIRVLSVPVAVGIGRISYALYLWHIPVRDVVGDEFSSLPHAIQPLIVLPFTFFAALVSYFLVERPALRLKDRLGWGRRAPVQQPAHPAPSM